MGVNLDHCLSAEQIIEIRGPNRWSVELDIIPEGPLRDIADVYDFKNSPGRGSLGMGEVRDIYEFCQSDANSSFIIPEVKQSCISYFGTLDAHMHEQFPDQVLPRLVSSLGINFAMVTENLDRLLTEETGLITEQGQKYSYGEMVNRLESLITNYDDSCDSSKIPEAQELLEKYKAKIKELVPAPGESTNMVVTTYCYEVDGGSCLDENDVIFHDGSESIESIMRTNYSLRDPGDVTITTYDNVAKLQFVQLHGPHIYGRQYLRNLAVLGQIAGYGEDYLSSLTFHVASGEIYPD